MGGQLNSSWLILSGFVIAGIASTGVLQIFQMRIAENLQQKIFARSAFEIAFRLPRIRLENLYERHAPELVNRFFDTITLQKGVAKLLLDVSSSSLQILFGLILLFLYNPLFIIFTVLFLILVACIYFFTAKRGLQTSLLESKYKYELVYWLEEIARINNTLRLAGSSSLSLEKTNGFTHRYLEARESHFQVLIQQYGLLVFFKSLITAGLILLGGALVMQQQLNIGQFVAAEIIILSLMGSIEKLVINMESLFDVLTALEKIAQLTDLPLEKYDGLALASDIESEADQKGLSIQVTDATFSYPGQNENLFEDLSLNISSGEKIIIRGSQGSGKSSILLLLAGLYDLKKGILSYNELPIDSLNLEALRGLIGDNLNHEQIFAGSVYDNIVMGRPEINHQQIHALVKTLQFEELIRNFPRGYDSQLQPGGGTISRSEAYKLLLLRCLIDHPRLILMEDNPNVLSSKERKSLFGYLRGLENHTTVLIVSEDPEIEQYFDRKIFLKDGMISTEPC